METKTFRDIIILIDAKQDREKLTAILAENGYKVWVEKKEYELRDPDFYVHFEVET